MKPSFKARVEPTKPSPSLHNQGIKKKVEQQIEDESEEFTQLGQSLVGQRQFIYLTNSTNNQQDSALIEQNISLIGTTQIVYFSNASSINDQESQKNQKLKDEINAFKPSSKIVREEPQNMKKAKSEVPGVRSNKGIEQEDENEFLQLENVGKWQKGKSTVISEQMKKLNRHYENRLTETKWMKRKPQISQEQVSSVSQRNKSGVKSESGDIDLSIMSNVKCGNDDKQLNMVNVKKGSGKQIQSRSEEMSVEQRQKRGWKKDKGDKKEEQVEQEQIECLDNENQAEQEQIGAQEQEDEQQSEEEQEQDQDQEEEDQEEQEEEDQQEQDQEEDQEEDNSQEEQQHQEEGQEEEEKQSSPEQTQNSPHQQPQQLAPKTQNKIEPQKLPTSQLKPKKWESTKNKTNPSIHLENTHQQQHNQIEDLTEGEIENHSLNPNWNQTELILLRILKLVN